MPGHWNLSVTLKISGISVKQSPMSSGAAITRGKSPKAAPSACHRSPCSVLVGTPVDGPARMQLIATTGISAIAERPRPSVISAKPPPEVAHMERTPPCAAPIAILMTPISSSTWRTMMPALRPCAAIQCSTPVEGLIG